MPDPVMILDCSDSSAPPVVRPPTPEEQAWIEAEAQGAALAAQQVAAAEQEQARDLLLVQQRAADDPAYAALARLALPPDAARRL